MGLNKLAKTSWGIFAILAFLGILLYLVIKKPSGQMSSSPSYYYNLYISGLGDGSGASGDGSGAFYRTDGLGSGLRGGSGGSGASTIAPPTYASGIGGIAQLESYYNYETPIYYNPTTHIAQINPPARSSMGGKGAVYAD